MARFIDFITNVMNRFCWFFKIDRIYFHHTYKVSNGSHTIEVFVICDYRQGALMTFHLSKYKARRKSG